MPQLAPLVYVYGLDVRVTVGGDVSGVQVIMSVGGNDPPGPVHLRCALLCCIWRQPASRA